MNKIHFSILMLFFSIPIIAQYSYNKYTIKNDSLLCLQDVSVYREFNKQNLYNEAVTAWAKAYNSCEGSKKIIYQDGVKFLKTDIKLTKDATTRKALIDSMMSLYNERVKYFGHASYVKGRQGIDLINSDRNRAEEAYQLLKESFCSLKEESDPAVIAHYMVASKLLYGKKIICSSELINNYLESVEIIEKQIKQAEDKKLDASVNKKVLKITNQIFAKTQAANCENIKKICENDTTQNTENLFYLKKIQHLLKASHCKEDKLYMQISLKLQSINPTSENAHLLSVLFAKKEEYPKSIEYIKQAIKLTQNDRIKAQYYREIAEIRCLKLKQYKLSKSDVLQSLNYQPKSGEAFMLLGDIYALASSNFAEDNFVKSSLLWAAADKYNMAKNLDKGLSAKVNQKIAYYKKYMPSLETSFMNGYKKGDKYTIVDWVNEETTVR